MDRRRFFKTGAQNTSQLLTEEVIARVESKARHWIRPPFAQPELEFLLSCTRCNLCIEACQYQVIFPLPAKRGAEVCNTPAMDLLNKGCHLCRDWPCVQACETGTLQLPIDETTDMVATESLPRLARVTVNKNICLPYLGPECGACAQSCPIDGALLWNMEKPEISDKCTGCALCREACITSPKAIEVASNYSPAQ